jgi:AbrB family looped-hinge helix DNA binding protein
MTLKIDRAGRVVLPKPVRDRYSLKAGKTLEIQETAEGVLLKPVQQRASLVTRDGLLRNTRTTEPASRGGSRCSSLVWRRAARPCALLIHRGKLPKGYDWSRLIEDDREDRMRNLAGQWTSYTGVRPARPVANDCTRSMSASSVLLPRKRSGGESARPDKV